MNASEMPVLTEVDGELRITFHSEEKIYPCSRELIEQLVGSENERRRLLDGLHAANRQLVRVMGEPHLYYATSRDLRIELKQRALNRLPWNKPKTVHPTNGHGTWLPVYWVWSRVDGDPLSQLGRKRWLKELDHPYRRGRGTGIKLGNVLLEVGVCYRKNLEPNPDQYTEYDDPGAVDALRARPMDVGIAEISTTFKRPVDGTETQADS